MFSYFMNLFLLREHLTINYIYLCIIVQIKMGTLIALKEFKWSGGDI